MAPDFGSLLDALPGLVWTAQRDGRLESVGTRWLDYTGLSPQDASGDGWMKAVHPDDRPGLVAAWARIVASRQTGEAEARLRRHDGAYRWFLFRASPIPGPVGVAPRWCGMNLDIDDARRAEGKLAAEKRLLELMAIDAPVTETLEATCREVEALAPDTACSVLLVGPGEEVMWVGGGPRQPDDCHTNLEGARFDGSAGPCSLAAALKAPVFAADLASDPRFADAPTTREIVAQGFRSCWAMPILSRVGEVIGALAIWRRAPEGPPAGEPELVERFAQVAGLAVERARAEEDLRAREAELRRTNVYLEEAQRLSRTGSFIWDLKAKDSVWSEELYRIFDGPPEAEGARAGQTVLQRIIHPEDAWLLEEVVAGVYDGVADFDVGFRILAASGLKHVHMVGHRVDPGTERPIYVGAVQDVTDTKLAETALRASEAELRRAYTHLTEGQQLSRTGSYTLSPATGEHIWSEELYRICEVEPGARVDMETLRRIIHRDDLSTFDAAVEASRSGVDPEIRFRIVTPKAGVKHLHAVAHRVKPSGGRTVFHGAIRDVTEATLAEEALSRARADLAHVSRVSTLGVLTASIAHEVNQPLAGIITNASTCLRMLAADPPDLEGARATAQRTIRDGNRASEVIQRLRGLFARREPSLEPFDLNDAAREVLALSASELQRRRVSVRPVFTKDLPSVRGDRVQLQQVILNLVLNAADAMAEVDDRPRGLAIATACEDGGRVRLWVRDNGAGLGGKPVEDLFRAFHTTKPDGMGIGLSISRSIVEAHGGLLWGLGNDDGPGATFGFSIPRGPQVEPAATGAELCRGEA